MTRRIAYWAFIVVALIVLAILNGALYTVGEGQVAVVTRFGRVIDGHVAAGLHTKLPFVDAVHVFNGRLRTLPITSAVFLTKGKKRVTTDAFVKWRVTDARQYLAALSGKRQVADERLLQVTTSTLRNAFGQQTLEQTMAGAEKGLVKAVDADVKGYGIQVVDVRVERIALSDSMIGDFEKRMEAAQVTQAQKVTATGVETAEAVRAQADQKRAAILADAYVKAQQIRGAGDAEAAALYAKAYDRHPRFFVFYRSLRAYEKGFANGHTVLVLGPRSGFLRYLPIGEPARHYAGHK